ncbi:type II toxin-antitoxin system RelE/ParE family toxin [Sphingobacterium wenxiniae]|uniref:ParE toxin of type II toxin-antitoxin system, parDE n=1 Tax=Sphingobacterium wenxiniae TaxID=683125 RepID=A0A1I6VBB5_9SPHI|nr:type II toxin-antitoxin system RelE/ParE family toxin [Sphingobacterium wenxiniae]SFT10957.1 ParE toxin of type II toxin-antitoxin system, parDE [Sphingobacterium wenxiniae]
MARLKLFWTETVVKQRNYVFSYWNERNGSTSYSKKLNRKINQRISLLKVYPEIGKKSSFKDVRIASLGHYCLLYKFDNTRLIIVGFWDGRQDPEKLIGLLKGNGK